MNMQEVKAPTIPFLTGEQPGIHAPLRGDDYFSLAREQAPDEVTIRFGNRKLRIATSGFQGVDQARYGAREFAHGGRASQPSRQDTQPVAMSPFIGAREQLPMTSPTDALMALLPEAASVVAAGAAAATSKQNRGRNALLAGMGVEMALLGTACKPVETAPRAAEVQQASLISEMRSWEGKALPDGTVLKSPFDVHVVTPPYAMSQYPEIPSAAIPYPGSVYLSRVGKEQFFLFVDASGNVTESAFLSVVPVQSEQGKLIFHLVTAENKKIGDAAFNLTGNINEPMAKITYAEMVNLPEITPAAKVNQIVDLAIGPAGQADSVKKREFMDYFVQVSTGAGPAFAAGEGTAIAVPVTPTAEVDVSPTPTATEIPTATPTETPDPMAGAPEGATGKNAKGEWIKAVTENGQTTEYAWTSLKDAKGEVLYEGWTDEKTQGGGIPLLDYKEVNLIPLSLFVAYDVPGGRSIESLNHQDNIDHGNGPNSLTAVTSAELFGRKNIGTSMSSQDERTKFLLDVWGGEVSLPIITSTGKSVEGKLSPDTGFITIVVPFDSLVPAEGNGVSEWVDPYPDSRSRFRSTVLGVDRDGNIIELLASETPLNELPDNMVRALALHLAANVIQKEDQTKQGFPITLQVFVQYSDAKGNKTVPDIIITRNP